jgi:hypothetical protein
LRGDWGLGGGQELPEVGLEGQQGAASLSVHGDLPGVRRRCARRAMVTPVAGGPKYSAKCGGCPIPDPPPLRGEGDGRVPPLS